MLSEAIVTMLVSKGATVVDNRENRIVIDTSGIPEDEIAEISKIVHKYCALCEIKISFYEIQRYGRWSCIFFKLKPLPSVQHPEVLSESYD